MKSLWHELLDGTEGNLLHGKETLEKVPLLAEKCFLSPSQKAVPEECARKVLSDPELLKGFAQILALLEEGILEGFSGRITDAVLEEPFPKKICGDIPEENYLFLLAVSCIPAGEKAFRKKGLPPEKLFEALDEVRAWCDNCTRNFSVTGLQYGNGFAWIVFRILPGIVLRFGRLEYNHCLAFPDILVFRHRKTGEICVMLSGKYDVNDRGEIAAQGEKIAFTTSVPSGIFGAYDGFPVSPAGKVFKETVRVDLEEYEILLRPGDQVLYMHIPELGPLTPEKVEDSFRQVKAFYAERGKDSFRPKGIVCGSWLFDPVLQEILPENANLPLFQKSGFLLPPKTPRCDAVFRVFGTKAVKEGIDAVPWKSTLQKALGEYLKKGGIFRGGRFFRLF